MRHSNFALLLFIFLVSCVKPSTGVDTSSGASFIIKEGTGKGYAMPLNPHARWQIPESVKFVGQVCMQERTSRVETRSQPFEIEDPETHRSIEKSTEVNGCLVWDEPIPFNYFAGQSGWIEIHRNITGKGVNLGTQAVTFVINPWAIGDNPRDTDMAVAFMREGSSTFAPVKLFEQSLAQKALAGEHPDQGQSQLVAFNVEARAIPEGTTGDSVVMRVVLDLQPKVRSRNASGAYHYDPVPDGSFDMMMQVLGSEIGAKAQDKVLLMGGDMHSTGQAHDGHLHAVFKVRQKVKANQGSLELALKIMPKDLNAYKSLRPYNGLHPLGQGTIVRGDNSGFANNECLDEDKCKYEDIIGATKNYQELMAAGYIHPDERYTFSTLKLRFTSIDPGETTTRRTVSYSATTCITDNQQGRSLTLTPVTVTYLPMMMEDPKDKRRVIPDPDDAERRTIDWHTDENGCLSWTGKAFHHYYQPEHFYEKEVIISIGKRDIVRPGHKKPFDVDAFNRHLKFYLNPWDDKFTFGWDSREFTPEFFEEIKSRPKVISRFFVGDYGYHTQRFLYNIDRFMDLEVKKWVLMNVTPQVLRYSGIVNARKMVEHLRDGIYLMKIAIQKDYLDPRDNSGWLLHNTPEFQEEMVQIGTKELRPKEYITTNTSLVRVVDGLIIYPVELAMRDLRLMRVRSNFLIQLEMVDERMVQAYHVFNTAQIQKEELEQKLKDYKALVDADTPDKELQKSLGATTETPPDLLRAKQERDKVLEDTKHSDMITARKDFEKRVEDVEAEVKRQIVNLKQFFDGGGVLGVTTDSERNRTGPLNLKPGQIITEPSEIDPAIEAKLKEVLQLNDFSTVGLPTSDKIDLNLFSEKLSGLERRTFVGPVIFLSNAYSDSMRATDNLDDSCRYNTTKPTPEDQLQLGHDFLDAQYDVYRIQMDNETNLFKNRQNNAYLYSPYFNSAKNLCYQNVDDLIERERTMNARRVNVSLASSLPFNYAERFNMDYVSLTDEPMLKVEEACRETKPDPMNKENPSARISVCDEDGKPFESHLVPTKVIPFTRINRDIPGCTEDNVNCQFQEPMPVMKAAELGDLLNAHASLDNSAWVNQTSQEIQNLVHGDPNAPIAPRFTPADYNRLFFNINADGRTAKIDPQSNSALCVMLSTKIARLLIAQKLTTAAELEVVKRIYPECMEKGALAHDVKYRVDKTGKYTFLGGLNLNFNVGESFSFSTSHGWGGGFDWVDFMSMLTGNGPGIVKSILKGKGAGAALAGDVASETEPSGISGAITGALDGKTGKAIDLAGKLLKPISLKWSSSMGNSEGTSVGVSTYLVSQIAGFDVELLDYERCAAIHLTKDFYQSITNNSYYFRHFDTSIDFQDPNVQTIFSRGLFICEGANRLNNHPVNVPESYFYFTQHFTEGDMLDQAELYNHPWLLALRGMRDFGTFVDRVQLVDVTSLDDYLKNMVGALPPRKKGWALHALNKAYQGVMPAFEGYYTVLNEGEPNLDVFALDQAELNRTLEQGGSAKDLPPHFGKFDTDPLEEINHRLLRNPENAAKLPATAFPANPYSVPTPQLPDGPTSDQ